ncbi:Gfo/Idh/MocA family protein [Tengunoibacter tsumagoiensis]|uniref:Oxidoreductase n=1 Tax=Tengunoibacter tsumagoiensis TaxID=2014871 RepID=A0A402A3G7_9CHLR|nr:Gfo/Idh/MocA family oxidoreductase [Tengunoibacter tsumagoiensis]GCE13622.1 oxidoreductase [Tengunoibacter tsumagoiensis]
MQKVKLALIGAGQRGQGYANYALKHPYEAQIVAVAEPDPRRRAKFQAQHALPDDVCYPDWQELLQQPHLADAVLICTQDRQHFAPAMAALDAGYHVLLEKPMSPDPLECLQMGQRASQVGRMFTICHVLRYTPFFSELKTMLDDGAIGRLISIQHNENVAYWHYAHSFVRGNWRNARESSPMILAKSCHDMDILLWLAGADCTAVSSFGSLSYFKAENAPAGAPQRCLDGCPVAQSCPYYAPRFYVNRGDGWPTSVISVETGQEAVLKALEEGPYGRCVYHCDNDVVDHQVVNLEFANEVTAVFTMCAFTNDISRTIKLMGTKGELWGTVDHEQKRIELSEFATGTRKIIHVQSEDGAQGHGGGDDGLMRDFLSLIREDRHESRTSASLSVQSHLMAFAAEEARISRRVVELSSFVEQLQR